MASKPKKLGLPGTWLMSTHPAKLLLHGVVLVLIGSWMTDVRAVLHLGSIADSGTVPTDFTELELPQFTMGFYILLLERFLRLLGWAVIAFSCARAAGLAVAGRADANHDEE